MAKHERQLIRETARDQLLGQTVCGEHVAMSRKFPWKEADLPALSIYTFDESSERDTVEGDLARTVDLYVTGAVPAVDDDADMDAASDALALEIEQAIDADPSLGENATDVTLVETKKVSDERTGEVLGFYLKFAVRYDTSPRV